MLLNESDFNHAMPKSERKKARKAKVRKAKRKIKKGAKSAKQKAGHGLMSLGRRLSR